MKATKFFTLILAVATLTFSAAASGQTFVVNWNTETWPSASLANDYLIGPGTVSFEFTDPTSAFVSGTPVDDLVLNGSSNTLETLHLQVDFEASGDSVEMRTEFVGYPHSIVTGVSFILYDIDRGGSPLDMDFYWQDRVKVKGILNGKSVVPTAVVNPAVVDVTITSDEVILDGLSNFYNNDGDAANVVINFGAWPIDTLLVTYTDGPLAGPTPATHGVGIGSIGFKPGTGCIDPPPDMVAWWTGDNDLAYAADTLGNHHGIPVNFTHAWIPKVGSGTLAFTPGLPAAYVIVPDALGLNFGTGELTIDAWIRTTADRIRYIVVKQERRNPALGYSLYLKDGTLVFKVCGLPGFTCGTVTSGNITVNDGNWHHIAATLSRGVTQDLLAVYIDGQGALPFSIPTPGLGNIDTEVHLLIGAGPGPPGEPLDFFDGPIDEIEIFSRALSATEIRSIYLADSAGKCKCVDPPPDMVAWFPADPSRPECGAYLRGGATCALGGKVDKAFTLNGSTAYVEIPDNPSLNVQPGANLSIDAWTLSYLDDGIQPIVNKRTPTNGLHARGYYMYLHFGRLAFQFLDGSFPSAPFIAPGPVIADGAWHHVAVTLNRNIPKGGTLYVDGEVVLIFGPQIVAIGPAETGSPLLIGWNWPPFPFEQGLWYFDGLIDEVELFDRVLDPDEIRSIFLAGSAGKCKPCWGRGIRVSQESAPNMGDFDDHVLGCIDAFETSYSTPNYYQWNPVDTSFLNADFDLMADRSHLFLVEGASDALSLFIVHDKPGNVSPGGKAEMAFVLSSDPNMAYRTVEDDPSSFPNDPDTYTPAILGTRSNVFASRNEWGTCCTDGQVLTELDGNWVMLVEFTEFDSDPLTPVIAGLDSWVAYSSTDGALNGRGHIRLVLQERRRVRLDCCPSPSGGISGPGTLEDADDGLGGDYNRVGDFKMPASAGGQEVTIRVKLNRMYIDKDEDASQCPVRQGLPDLQAFEGQVLYLGPPEVFDNNSLDDPKWVGAKLQCTPHIRDWSASALAAELGAGVGTDMIYYYGAEVVPCSIHSVQQATQSCVDSANEDCFSAALEVRTALWGDVWPPFGNVNFSDIGAEVDAFKSIPFSVGPPPSGAPNKWRAMLRDNEGAPASEINFTDIGKTVDAFKTIAYAEDGPSACP